MIYFNKDCGVLNRGNSEDKLTSGKKAEAGEFPWQVWLAKFKPQFWLHVTLTGHV